jgi:hypothetical protein
MPTVELTTEQVVDLVKQLTPDQKRTALLALAAEAQQQRDERMAFAESQLRLLAGQRGQNWDALSEEEREAFVDLLLHEDRPCRS